MVWQHLAGKIDLDANEAIGPFAIWGGAKAVLEVVKLVDGGRCNAYIGAKNRLGGLREDLSAAEKEQAKVEAKARLEERKSTMLISTPVARERSPTKRSTTKS